MDNLGSSLVFEAQKTRDVKGRDTRPRQSEIDIIGIDRHIIKLLYNSVKRLNLSLEVAFLTQGSRYLKLAEKIFIDFRKEADSTISRI